MQKAYAYDEDGSLLGEYGMGGAASAGQSQFLYLPTASGPLPIAADIDGSAYAIHTDHLGTPRRLTQADGQAAWQWAYTPYGDEAPTLGAKRFTSEATTPTTGSTSIPPVRFNLRYPGQYFDEESGLHYNYFRSYNPATGRYTQADPIGLNGGWNRFGYVEGNPISLTDPLGLATYMCRAPLHALTGAFGERRATWAMSNVPTAHHRYLCVPGQCGGQDQRGEKWSDPLWGPGKPSKDEFNAERCQQKEPDNACIESCVRRRLDGPRPTYGIPLATDCQEWAEEVLNTCRYECSSNTPTDRPYIGYPRSGRRNKL